MSGLSSCCLSAAQARPFACPQRAHGTSKLAYKYKYKTQIPSVQYICYVPKCLSTMGARHCARDSMPATPGCSPSGMMLGSICAARHKSDTTVTLQRHATKAAAACAPCHRARQQCCSWRTPRLAAWRPAAAARHSQQSGPACSGPVTHTAPPLQQSAVQAVPPATQNEQGQPRQRTAVNAEGQE